MNIQEIVNQMTKSVADINAKIEADISTYISTVQNEIDSIVTTTDNYMKDVQTQLMAQMSGLQGTASAPAGTGTTEPPATPPPTPVAPVES